MTANKNRCVAVTGASGFVGGHLVEALLASGVGVIALTRPSSRLPESWRGRVERVDCADWTLAGLDAALGPRDINCLYHLAAYGVRPDDRDMEAMLRVNVGMATELVRLCHRRMIGLLVAGSNSEYSEPTPHTQVTEQSPLETTNLYGSSKATGSMLASALASELGVRLRVLRLFNVYGPGEQSHRLLSTLAAGLIANRRVPLTAGTQVRDFIYIVDVVEAFIAASAQIERESSTSVAIWNICTGVGHTVRTFASTVATALGADSNLLGFGEQPLRQSEFPWLVGNADRIKAELGWTARYDLPSGIRAAVASMTERAEIPLQMKGNKS